jgi:hypothetical protein
MAEEEERQGPRPANDNGSPNGEPLDPPILRTACATPKEAAEDRRAAEDRPTRDYLETTRTFWQPYAERELTREDAREMAHNLIGFFTVLREWTLRERERATRGVVETGSTPAPRKCRRPRSRATAKDKMQS